MSFGNTFKKEKKKTRRFSSLVLLYEAWTSISPAITLIISEVTRWNTGMLTLTDTRRLLNMNNDSTILPWLQFNLLQLTVISVVNIEESAGSSCPLKQLQSGNVFTAAFCKSVIK